MIIGKEAKSQVNSVSKQSRARFGAGPGIAERIAHHIQFRGLVPGTHVSAQEMADLFSASRTPVNHALRLLADRGLIQHKQNRGFFVSKVTAGHSEVESKPDDVAVAYEAVIRDRLNNTLGDEVTESELQMRYGLTRAQMQMVLNRVAQEGWIERRAGYGWAFTEMLTTAEALNETFRLRLVLEPASLLEPGYKLDRAMAAECRRNEIEMLAGNLSTMPLDALFDQRANFHVVLVAGCHNRFFVDTIRRVNRIRRLLSYQAMSARGRYVKQCEEHLAILDLVEAKRNAEAADLLRLHLETVQMHYQKALFPATSTRKVKKTTVR